MTTITSETITLTNGDLSFTADKQGDGDLVLCLHGFPDTRRSWRYQLPVLAAAGYTAVAPQLRGYEPSSVPADGVVNQNRIVEDVLAWADQLGADRFHVVGHDWGASIAYLTAAAAPERVKSCTMMAVPHPIRFAELMRTERAQVRRSWYMMFFQLKGISDWWVRRRDFAFIEWLWKKWSPGWAYDPQDVQAVKEALAGPGCTASALGYYRAALRDQTSPDALATAALIGQGGQVPTLGLAGVTDGCIGVDVFQKAMLPEDFPKGLQVETIDGAGHFLHQEKPDQVNDLLVDWLKKHA